MVIVLRILECCLWVLEKFIKFLNKNAYIQVALMGTNFCTSAKNAFQLILRNMVRFGVVAILGTVIHYIGWTVITVGTAAVGYVIFQAFHPDADILMPMFTYVATGYMVAHLFMNVFGLGVDTSLQCFIAAEEMGVAQEYVPSELKSLVEQNPGKKKWALFGGSKESVPVVEYLKSQSLLRQVQCEKAVEEVWKDVRALFGPSVVFVLGGPGAGKGTLCGKIVEACGYQHLSAGDLLREERRRPGSRLGELIEAHIKEGKLVPASIVVELLLKAMREHGWEGGKYLIDGFPRTTAGIPGAPARLHPNHLSKMPLASMDEVVETGLPGLEEVDTEVRKKRQEVLEELLHLRESLKENQSQNLEAQQALKVALTQNLKELEVQGSSLKILQETSKELQSQLQELSLAPQKQIFESLKVDMELLPDLSHLVEQQGRLLNSIRTQDLGDRLAEMQRTMESQGRLLEAFRSQEATYNSEIQRSLEANTVGLQSLRAQETGQHVVELQRLVETQTRTVESLRSQSLQVQEMLQSQDPEKRLSELKRSSDSMVELFQEVKMRIFESTSKLQEASNDYNLRSLRMLEAAQAGIGKTLSQLQDQQAAVGKFHSSLSEYRADMAAWQSEAAEELHQAMQTQAQEFQAVKSHVSSSAELVLSGVREALEMQQGSHAKQLCMVKQSIVDQLQNFDSQFKQISQLQSGQLEIVSQLAIYGSQLSEQDTQLKELAKPAASQKTLEQFMMQMEAKQQEAHAEHVKEMQKLQKSFATEMDCQGLRVELDASKNRQLSIEAQQVIRERSWEEESISMSRNMFREASLAQQLQQAIVDVEVPVDFEEMSFLPPPPPPRVWPRILLALVLVGLLALVAHFGWHRSFDNLQAWEETVQDQVLVRFVLFLDVNEQVMEARLLERGKTSGRADDNIESIRKRFLTFHKESIPVVERFQKEGRIRRIDADQHPDAVWRDVQVLFGPSVVFVLGGPGAGKGTQCTKIAETFGYTHLSAGDLLREERSREGSEYGELINRYIKDGKLVPVEITIKLLKQAMMKHGWEGGRYLVDGFPRSFDNLRGWEEVIGNTVRVKFVLFFDLSEETMQARLMERGKTSGRADDNLESIKKRFVTFQQESMPVVEKFHLKGLVRRINAEQSAEQVWRDVQRNFGPSVIFVLGGPGAGKGTQCTRIAANFGFQHLSAGDLLREERKRPGSELGELIESHIKEGKLVPVSIVVQLLQKAMEERGWEDGKYLIDGFPRSFDNLQGWNEALGHKVDVKCCLFFDCSEAVMEARLLERGKTSGRADDNLESIRKRFATYTQESLPVVEKFSSEGLMRRISAEQNLDDVWSCVQVMHNERDGLLLNQVCWCPCAEVTIPPVVCSFSSADL
ncbi:unnamed protein product [Durusdinium trenchii]|uniref:UMP-CMP kinase n=1 Tax=Durusdinium trenchii TaxID=1381693 RepID=A0ABP0SPP8_9DINO